jgi:hypothetical protein
MMRAMWPARGIALATFLLALLLTPPLVAAQAPSAETTEDSTEINARRLYAAGAAAFEEHRYADALAYFEQTYALTPLPRLLYNIGLAAEHLGDRARAVSSFEQYLAAMPDAENRVEVEGRLTILRSGASSPPDADEATPPPPAELVDPSAAAGPSGDTAGASVDGGVLLGVSIAVLVGGAVVAAIGANDYATVNGLADGAPYASVRDAGDRALPMLGVGIAAAGLGLVGAVIGIVLLGSRHDDPSAPTTALRLTPGGLGVEGSF